MRKNVASQVISAQLVSATDGSAVTTGTTTVYVCGDGGTQASGGTATHEGQGLWSFAPSQADTNYNHVTFTFVNSSAISATVQVYPVGYDPTQANLLVDAVKISGDSVAADNLEAATDGTGYNIGGGSVVIHSLGAQAKLDVNAEADTAFADAGVTTTRTGYLDKLNISGSVASAADIAAITQAQRVRINLFSMLERPDSGSTAFRIYIYSYNEQHQAEDLDFVPAVTAENNTATDRSANLGTVTKVPATTGIYYVDYTVASTHEIEGIVLRVTATENMVATQYSAAAMIVDTTAVDFTSSDRTKLEAVYNKLPSASYLTGTASSNGSGYSTLTTSDIATQSQTGAAAALTAYDAATGTDVSAVETKVDTIDSLIDQIVAEVVTVQSLPGQGAPPATAKIAQAIMYLYKQFRNKKTQTNSEYKLFADNGTTVDQKSTVSDDGTTTTVGEMDTGA